MKVLIVAVEKKVDSKRKILDKLDSTKLWLGSYQRVKKRTYTHENLHRI